jgi:polyribonucleotide nucleotidyltransferase
MAEALHQAKEGRLHILGKMAESLEAPRPDYKPHAPRNYSFTIARDMIGALIGPGGKIIQEIQRTTNSTIVVEEKDDMGHVSIFANNQDDMDAAVEAAKGYTASPEINTIYTGKITSIREFGAFVEFLPGREGLLHISEVAWERLEDLDGILAEGDEVEVKLLEINEGKFRLSRKALLPKPEGYVERERRGPRGGGDRGPRRGGDRDRRGGGDRRGGDRDRGPRRRS